jgi:hypothetical protein
VEKKIVDKCLLLLGNVRVTRVLALEQVQEVADADDMRCTDVPAKIEAPRRPGACLDGGVNGVNWVNLPLIYP